jgi:hypothetical protein
MGILELLTLTVGIYLLDNPEVISGRRETFAYSLEQF